MITAQVESIEATWPELAEIFLIHHAELALFKDQMPLDPQYEEYVTRERAGQLFLVTVRTDGRIAAYYTVQLAPGFHYRTTLIAHMDMCYVIPSQRNRGLSWPLFRCVERELRRRGVQLWYSGYKTGQTMAMPGLLDLLGFEHADTYRAKWIGT